MDFSRIWEGTTTVLALDLARASRDISTLFSFTSVSDEHHGYILLGDIHQRIYLYLVDNICDFFLPSESSSPASATPRHFEQGFI